MNKERTPLPVTLISGFLGSGKTTLVNHILRSEAERRIGVMVNDFGQIAIDADLIVGQSDEVITLANGCICCSLRQDLSSQIFQICETPDRPEHLLVETSGISDPANLVRMFLDMQRLGTIRLDSILGLIDAENFLDTLESKERQLAISQIRSADILLLNKTDLVDETHLNKVSHAISQLNPHTRVLNCQHGQVPFEQIIAWEGPEEQKRDLDLSTHPEMVHSHPHSLHYHSQSTISFKRLVPFLTQLPKEIIRAKGYLHLAERPNDCILLHLTGRRIHVRTIGSWEEKPPKNELIFLSLSESLPLEPLREELQQCLEPEQVETIQPLDWQMVRN